MAGGFDHFDLVLHSKQNLVGFLLGMWILVPQVIALMTGDQRRLEVLYCAHDKFA